MRIIDANALQDEYIAKMEEVVKSTTTPNISLEALSLLCGYMLIMDAPTIEVVLCKDCKHYKQSAVADRKMCFRKDVDGVEVCYDFQPYDSCTYGERKEVEE